MHGLQVVRNVALGTILVLALGCGSDDGGGVPGERISVSGTVFTLDSGAGADASTASGVTVTATADFNGNGRIDAAERVSAESDSDGTYVLECPAEPGRRLVVRFALEGYAPALKTVDVGSLGDVRVDATLAQMATLTCQESGCADQAGEVQIQGVSIASGYAQVFNPVVDADRFPGGFDDDEGNLLVSAVFAAFDLYDDDGQPIDDLGGESATVRLKTPRDTWNVITDLRPDNGRIDVPMYSFDELSGEWTAEGSGWLENGTGDTLDEDQLAAIRDGSYADVVFSVFEAGHFSYWNVDWPIDTHTCVHGRVVDAAGNPVAGAKVSIQGLTYSGTSSPQLTDETGTFCVDVMRSENAGEDVDNDGTTGETQQILVTIVHEAKGYRFGPFELPTTQASCPTGCLELADLALSPANEIQVRLCRVTGTVRLDGTPVEGTYVYTDDETLDPELRDAVCTSGAGCTGYGITDATGAFDFTGAFAAMFKVAAYHGTEDGTVSFLYEATRTFLDCPAEPVALELELSSCYGELLTIEWTSGEISWAPAVRATMVIVADAAGTPKWYVIGGEGGFASPVTYGTLPAGAMQLFPYLPGTPPPAIASGDLITVYPVNGLVPYGGAMCYSTGQYTVP
jgi:hypothetical protein